MTVRQSPRRASAAVVIALAASQAGFANAEEGSARCDALTAEAIGTPRLAVTDVLHAQSDEQTEQPHCVVRGHLDERVGQDGHRYAIGFEMRLPDAWNGRFLHQANGGADGAVVPAYGRLLGGDESDNALSRGFAVLSSDAGHDGEAFPELGLAGGSAFGLDPQARLDYGYQATPRLFDLGSDILRARYGREADYAYMAGCSNGGRHGVVAASRYPELYDGILAGAPAIRLPQAALKGPNDVQAVEANGLELRSAFTPADMSLVGQQVLGVCDAFDGAEDGLVGDLMACQRAFDVESLLCGAGEEASCLSQAQVAALSQMMDGPRTSDGRALYASFPYDSGIGGSNWRFWRLESTVPPWQNYPLTTTLGGASLAMIFTTPPTEVEGTVEALLDFQRRFDLDGDAARIAARQSPYDEAPVEFMSPPDVDDPTLAAFREAGGRLIVFHGSSDPTFSVGDTIAWYERLDANHDGDAESFARFYPIPGMTHCSGGPATDAFDLLPLLVDWVEEGTAPATPIASARSDNDEVPADWSPSRTRPLCDWPLVARYDGAGDPERAESFRCEP